MSDVSESASIAWSLPVSLVWMLTMVWDRPPSRWMQPVVHRIAAMMIAPTMTPFRIRTLFSFMVPPGLSHSA